MTKTSPVKVSEHPGSRLLRLVGVKTGRLATKGETEDQDGAKLALEKVDKGAEVT